MDDLELVPADPELATAPKSDEDLGLVGADGEDLFGELVADHQLTPVVDRELHEARLGDASLLEHGDLLAAQRVVGVDRPVVEVEAVVLRLHRVPLEVEQEVIEASLDGEVLAGLLVAQDQLLVVVDVEREEVRTGHHDGGEQLELDETDHGERRCAQLVMLAPDAGEADERDVFGGEVDGGDLFGLVGHCGSGLVHVQRPPWLVGTATLQGTFMR